MVMPELVNLYKPPGGKYHLQPLCAGDNAEVQEIHEIDFLSLLREGKVCRGCIGDPKEFALIVERDIIKRIRILVTRESISDGNAIPISIGDKKYMLTIRFEIGEEPI